MFSEIVCCVLITYFIYRYLVSNYDYWKKKNVPYEKPMLLFGNIKDFVLMKKSLQQLFSDLYYKFPGSPYVGFYKMRTPCLLITNPEDIEQVLVHDADFFGRNDVTIDPEVDPIVMSGLFFLSGQKWRRSRALFTPLFSSAKVKHATPALVQATKKMLEFTDKRKVCEARDLLTRYVAGATALSAFGIDGETFDKDDSFYMKLGQVLDPNAWTVLKMLCVMLLPRLAKLLKFKIIPDDSVVYIKQVIATALKHRKENNINNNDFLDEIMALKSDTVTEIDIVAWCFAFFSESTSSNQGSYILYALAGNPEIQKKLKAEIDEVLSEHNGEITYDAIQEMSYLDYVVSETMRLYPAVPINMKMCTGYYEFPMKEGDKEVISLEPGMSLVVPVAALHHDERYFEKPKEFNPERFSEKNRGKIQKGTYMPFGLGKRICAGMKFGYSLMKVSIVALIKNYEITLNEKTVEPLELDPKFLMAVPKSGLWINFTKRK